MGEYKKLVESVAFGAAPRGGWFGFSALADNEKALLLGGGVMAVKIVGTVFLGLGVLLTAAGLLWLRSARQDRVRAGG